MKQVTRSFHAVAEWLEGFGRAVLIWFGQTNGTIRGA